MFKILDGREQFYQWDINRKLLVQDASITEVHFCNRTEECSLVVEVVDGVANVPNILLQDSWKIKVFGYDGEATKHSATFGVIARSKPADYVYTETEVKRWEEYGERIAALEEASGEVPDITAELAEFKDKEIAWEKNYFYDTTELEGKYAWSSFPMFELKFDKVPGYSSSYNYWIIRIQYRLAIAKHSVAKGVEYLVETPLKVTAKQNNTGYLNINITNLANMYDAGIVVDGEIFTFNNYFLDAIVDGEAFYEGEVRFSDTSGSQSDGSGYIALEVNVDLKTKDETIADAFLPEIEAMFSAYKDTFILCYRNTPEVETVNAKYLGGSN